MLLLTGCSHIHIVFLPTRYHYNLICAILTVSYLCLLIEYLAGLHLLLSHPAVSFQIIIVLLLTISWTTNCSTVWSSQIWAPWKEWSNTNLWDLLPPFSEVDLCGIMQSLVGEEFWFLLAISYISFVYIKELCMVRDEVERERGTGVTT